MTDNEIQNLKEKILLVKEYMSVNDIAEEFGYQGDAVRRVAKMMGVELLSPKQVRLNYLRQMSKKKTIYELSKILDIHLSHLKVLAKENHIDLHEIIHEEPKEVSIIIIKPAIRKTSLHSKTAKETYKEELKEMLEEKVVEDRIIGTYTQSHSPYRIADEIRDIKIL